MLERESEYSYLTNQYKLQKIQVAHFRKFFKNHLNDRNFLFDMLSKSLISAKNNFIKLYDEQIGIRNIHFLDRSVDDAFNSVFLSVLKEN